MDSVILSLTLLCLTLKSPFKLFQYNSLCCVLVRKPKKTSEALSETAILPWSTIWLYAQILSNIDIILIYYILIYIILMLYHHHHPPILR